MNRIRIALATITAYITLLTGPRSVDQVTSALRKQVTQLERLRERHESDAKRLGQQIANLRSKRDVLEAEASKAWRTANKFRSLLED